LPYNLFLEILKPNCGFQENDNFDVCDQKLGKVNFRNAGINSNENNQRYLFEKLNES